jgi:Trk K+ transport system NAD-binding subunit
MVMGGPELEDVLAEAGAETARGMLDLTVSSEETLRVCTIARERFGIPYVISRISDVELLPRLQELGVKVVEPALATAMALEGALRYPTAFDVLLRPTGDVEVGEVRLTNRDLHGRPLRRIRLPGDALILSVQRDGVTSVPNADTTLQHGDRIGLIGSPDALDLAVAMLRG